MRVLHVVTRDQRRGAEVDATQIHGVLERRGRQGRVVALAPAPPGLPGLGLPALGPSPLHPRTLVALRREALRHDVVVAHGSTTLPASVAALWGHEVPLVYRTIGDPGVWTARPTRRLRVRALLRRVDAVAALGPGSRDAVVRRYGVPEARVHVATPGQPAEHFRPAGPAERRAARVALGLAPGAPVAVLVAALGPEKRVPDAVRAVSRLRDVVLLVAGDGPARVDAERAVPPGAEDRVRFLGQLDDVRAALHAADVALLTSATEGVPGALVQAGLCGLPGVCTRVGFVPEVVLDGVTGRVVPVGDVPAVSEALLEALSRRREWGDAARRHCVASFSMEVAAGGWERLLDAVMDTRTVTAG
ncbi:MAG: glycosyltransferase family 4 protein [Actinomycetes bacterium]